MTTIPDPVQRAESMSAANSPTLTEVEVTSHRLAHARRLCAEYKAALDTLFADFYTEPHVQALRVMLQDAQAAREQADQDLRDQMVATYHATGATRLGTVGEVRLMHEIVYHCSDAELITAMKARMPDVVIVTEQIDRRKLEKRLRTEPDTQLPGVQVHLTAKAFVTPISAHCSTRPPPRRTGGQSMTRRATQPVDFLYQPHAAHSPRPEPHEHTLCTRLQRQGAAALADAELLAILLQDEPGPPTLVPCAEQLLREQNGLIGLARVPVDELQALGAGAVRLKAALELGRRLVQATPADRRVLNSASKVAEPLLLDMRPLEQEVLKCVLLTTRLHLIKIVDVHQGTLNSNTVRAGDVFREPVRLGAAAVILAHNHPSGDPTPSSDDIETTRHLIAAGELLDIAVLDHLVIGDTWVSMRAQGLGWPAGSSPHPDLPVLH